MVPRGESSEAVYVREMCLVMCVKPHCATAHSCVRKRNLKCVWSCVSNCACNSTFMRAYKALKTSVLAENTRVLHPGVCAKTGR